MNQIRRYTYSSISLLLITAYMHGTPVKLDSTILAQIDGLSIGIDGDSLAHIKQYDSQLMSLLLGKRDENGQRTGQYIYNGKAYTMCELSEIESVRGSNQEFAAILRTIRLEFEQMSSMFRSVARGTKSFMSILIEESCAKRNRLNSILYIWAKTDEEMEEELFDLHVKSLKDLQIFLTDLHNFLTDLIFNCPKARKQFQDNVSKFNKIKSLMPGLNISTEVELSFLKHMSLSLSSITFDEITLPKIRKLFEQFNTK